MTVTRNVPARSGLSVQWATNEEFSVSVRAGQVTVRPFAGLVSGVRTTVPAKLSVLVTFNEITELGLPTSTLTELPIEIVKSPTWTIVLAECGGPLIEPVPVIVTE